MVLDDIYDDLEDSVKQAIPAILKQYKNQSIINKEKYYPEEKAKPKKDSFVKT